VRREGNGSAPGDDAVARGTDEQHADDAVEVTVGAPPRAAGVDRGQDEPAPYWSSTPGTAPSPGVRAQRPGAGVRNKRKNGRGGKKKRR
jgi:hypothetical protein